MKNFKNFIDKDSRKALEVETIFFYKLTQESISSAVSYILDLGASFVDVDNYQILYYIDEYTKSSNNGKSKQMLFLKNLDYVNDVEFSYNPDLKLNDIKISTKNGLYDVMKFSDVSPMVSTMFPEVLTSERGGKCYDLAYKIVLSLGRPCTLVVANVCDFTDYVKYIHCFVETTIAGHEYVIDGMYNLIINKDAYYRMQNVEVINKIDKETLYDDLANYGNYHKVFRNDLYNLFRDEVIYDLERNKTLFKK